MIREAAICTEILATNSGWPKPSRVDPDITLELRCPMNRGPFVELGAILQGVARL